MAVKNILCAYNGSGSSDAALRGCFLMHKQYDAHVTGLLAHGGSQLDERLLTWIPKSLQQPILELEQSTNQKIEEQFFNNAAGAIAANKLHWVSDEGRSNHTVAEHARMFDLTVMGQFDPLVGHEHLELYPDQVAIMSGRPVLIFPRDWNLSQIPESAVLAWDGKRTASRALFDSMQILETKKKIVVLMVDTGKRFPPGNGLDIKEALNRHGVEVDLVTVKANGKPVGEVILDYCDRTNAELLVMGAYQHSVFREDLVGGVTNTIITQAALPVLLSH